jgi:pilus assembly protein CpaD
MARMIRANTLFSALVALSLAGLTAGCASGWQESYSNKRNTVELVRLTHSVQFADGANSLSPDERMHLESFLSDVGAGYGDEAWIDAGNDPLGAARSGAIMTALSHHGIIASSDNLAYGAALQPGEVRLVIGRYTVTPPECPDWRKPADNDYQNTPSSNYGCATATNLGQMVANPRDLLDGRTYGGPDTDRATKAVEDYRKGSVETKTAQGTN